MGVTIGTEKNNVNNLDYVHIIYLNSYCYYLELCYVNYYRNKKNNENKFDYVHIILCQLLDNESSLYIGVGKRVVIWIFKIKISNCNPLPNSYIRRALSLYRSWEAGCNLDFQNPNFELQPASPLLYKESSLSI